WEVVERQGGGRRSLGEGVRSAPDEGPERLLRRKAHRGPHPLGDGVRLRIAIAGREAVEHRVRTEQIGRTAKPVDRAAPRVAEIEEERGSLARFGGSGNQ